MERTAGPRPRLLSLGERLPMAWADDVRAVLRVVEMGRVGGFVAAHAAGRRHLELDGRPGLVLHVIAAGSVAVLALHVLPPDALAVAAGTARTRAVDAADATPLLPARDVAADEIGRASCRERV